MLMEYLKRLTKNSGGQTLVELLLAVGLAAVILPAILTGLVSSRDSRVQQTQRTDATAFMKEAKTALRTVRESGWTNVSTNGTYHPTVSGNTWALASGPETVGDLTRSILISDTYRDATSGAIVQTGGTLDPSTKKVDVTISWTQPKATSVTSTLYLSRYLDNIVYTQTTMADFNGDTLSNVVVPTPPTGNGEVRLANNNKAKWCSPSFVTDANNNEITIDLPDGPPVAVAARPAASVSTPNDVFVATSPNSNSTIKMAYVNVTADSATPSASLVGKFTMDSAQYSSGTYPSNPGLNNDFKTNDVAYYTSPGGKTYALLATTKPDREIVAVQINNGSGNAWQDPTNHIYKYWTYFNTRRYQGNSSSTPNQDQAPFGYGAVSVDVLENRGYMLSGGYLYVFDLSNIDSKSTSSGLDMVGCRIELDGYDCNPGSGTDRKYDAGQTGTSWGDTTSPAHNDCSDGGNIELYSDNDVAPVKVGSNIYVFVAVGAGTNPEFDIVNATNAPTSGSALTGSSCGRISGGSSSWKRISSLDMNNDSGTEEAANSVYSNSDGTRAYLSSNGGIDSNHDGSPDSYQLYVIDTSSKTAPKFLSGSTSSPPPNGYYYGSGGNQELYPRRSLTVLNGERAILVGKDGTANATDAKEYQVVDMTTETTPTYCGSVNYDNGFNDLTSVSEADGDNFVYMVANTSVNELKIIQGGPDNAIYSASGTLTSSIFDTGFTSSVNRYSASMTIPANTSIGYQFAIADPVSGSCSGSTYNYLGPDGTASTYYTATNGAILQSAAGIGGYKNPGRCLRYKSFFSTTDQQYTPVLNDILINYAP